jgi:hypothetical protein
MNVDGVELALGSIPTGTVLAHNIKLTRKLK